MILAASLWSLIHISFLWLELEVWSISTGPKKGSIEGAIFSVRMWWKYVPYIHHPSLYSINPSNSPFFGGTSTGTLGVQVGWPADVFLRIWTFRGVLQIASVRLRFSFAHLISIGRFPRRLVALRFECLRILYVADIHTLCMASSKITFRRLKNAPRHPKNPTNTWWEAVWRPCHGDVWGVQIPPQQQVFGCLGMTPCFNPHGCHPRAWMKWSLVGPCWVDVLAFHYSQGVIEELLGGSGPRTDVCD